MKTLAAFAVAAAVTLGVVTPAFAKVKKPLPPPVEDQIEPPVSFNPEEATRAIRARMSIVRACFERASRLEPGIEGKLQLGFHIGDQGQVRATDVEVDGLRAPVDPAAAAGLTRCIRQQALNWRLANSTPVGGAHVSYVFVFEAAR